MCTYAIQVVPQSIVVNLVLNFCSYPTRRRTRRRADPLWWRLHVDHLSELLRLRVGYLSLGLQFEGLGFRRLLSGEGWQHNLYSFRIRDVRQRISKSVDLIVLKKNWTLVRPKIR